MIKAGPQTPLKIPTQSLKCLLHKLIKRFKVFVKIFLRELSLCIEVYLNIEYTSFSEVRVSCKL